MTTLTLALLIDGKMRHIQIGDSGLILVGQRGKLKYKSLMHSPIGHAVESGLLTEKQALKHPDLNIVDNVIGMPEMKIEIGPRIKLSRYDTLFLASDGVFDNLTTDELNTLIRHGALEKIAKNLADACSEQLHPLTNKPFNKDDDICFILARHS